MCSGDALSNGREALAMCQAYEDRIAELAGHLAEVDNCRAVNLMAMRVPHREWLTLRVELECCTGATFRRATGAFRHLPDAGDSAVHGVAGTANNKRGA